MDHLDLMDLMDGSNAKKSMLSVGSTRSDKCRSMKWRCFMFFSLKSRQKKMVGVVLIVRKMSLNLKMVASS